MTNVYHLPPEKRRYRVAAKWVTKVDRGLSKDEERRLKDWMAESSENRDLFLRVAKQWDRFNELSRLADLFPEPVTHQRKRFRFLGYATAASVVIAVTAVFLIAGTGLNAPGDREPTIGAQTTAVYETAVGEQSTVALADGSRVTLNTNSRLDVRYSDFHRVLTLMRGEIHVDVAPDKDRPLTVFARDQMVQAVGTSFGVEIRDNKDIEVVVTEGKVLVSVRPNSSAGSVRPQVPVLPPSTLTVAQGEEVRLGGNTSTEIRGVSDEEIRVRLAWRDGDLVFRGEPLGEAMAEVGRYTTVEFVFLDNQLKEERIVGRFKAGDVEGLLAVLRENLSITYEKTTDGRILLGGL